VIDYFSQHFEVLSLEFIHSSNAKDRFTLTLLPAFACATESDFIRHDA
jgi:hypothetical protein